MLNKKQLAEFLNVSIPTIDRYMKEGMPYVKLPSGTVRFDLDEVKKWLKGEE